MRALSIFSVAIVFICTSFKSGKELPVANQKVIEYVNAVIDTKIGSGNSLDLVIAAKNHIEREGITAIGKKSKKVLPGDFISFHNAQIAFPKGGHFTFEEHHGIIYKVESKNVFIIAHQNPDKNEVVKTLRIDLNYLKSGEYKTEHP